MQNRFVDISYMRVLAMLLVVFGHCICPYSIWQDPGYTAGFQVDAWEITIASISQIHLPLFFLIAGFLYGYKRLRGGYSDKPQFVKNKIERVIVPYVLVGSFMCFIQGRSAWEMMLGVSHLWFLMTIFECYLLGGVFDFVLNWSDKGKIKLAVACCLMIVITVHWNLPTRFLTLERVLHDFPFYLMGMMAGSMNLERYAKYRSLALAALVCSLIVLPIQHYFLHKPTCDQLIGLCVVLPFFFVLRISHVSGSSNWLNSLDKHSMGIYIIHQILQQEMNKTQVFHSLLVQHEYLYPLLQFVFLILFCWLVSALAHRSKYAKYILG